jgi:hypothetical protein
MKGGVAAFDLLATSGELFIPQTFRVLVGRSIEALEQPVSDVGTVRWVQFQRGLEDLFAEGGIGISLLASSASARHPWSWSPFVRRGHGDGWATVLVDARSLCQAP